jgi:4-amino-4-deoxy-L-arabinose transferase-like glycosyltransferase
MLGFAVTFVAFYPRTFAVVDEDAYLTQALLLRAGHLSYERSGIPAPHMTVGFDGRQVSKYPPGNALFLLPFTLLGWRGAFVSGLLLAVIGTWIYSLVMRRLVTEAHPGWALLYLFYPAVVIAARTVMSDLLATTLILTSFYCLIRRGWWLLTSGVTMGLACLVRYSSAVLVPVYLALCLIPPGARLRAGAQFLSGVLPPAVLILSYNSFAYGGPLRFPMYLTGSFSLGFLPHNLLYYLPLLLGVYPLMLLGPGLAGRRRCLYLGLPAYTLLALYCLFSYTYERSGLAGRLTIGLRYLLPAVPFFVLGITATALNLAARLRIPETRLRVLRWVTVGLTFSLTLAIQHRHSRYLRVQESYQRLLYARVPETGLLLCNRDVSELISYAWGARDWRHIAEFNVPARLEAELTGTRQLYAALLEKPGEKNEVVASLFETLLARYPGRTALAETDTPYRFRLYKLR